MKKLTTILVACIVIGFGCRKHTETDSCGCNSPQTESVKNIFGIVIETDDGFEILSDEKGLLKPCSELAANLKTGSQAIILSGTLKTSCKEIPADFSITPIEISEYKLSASAYTKTDITLTIIKSEDYGYPKGFGYLIEDTRPGGKKILQPHIPVIQGLVPFSTPEQATKTGMLVIYLQRKGFDLPSLSMEVLQYINIVN